MRRIVAFPCAGDTLIGTLDGGTKTTGLLIVSGGNEIRAGAHRGMAMLAQRLAADGIPVFRFDRRGIGDSTGDNRGFADSAADITAARDIFVAESGVTRIVGFGNCDAATALALFNADLALDALVLANPWVVEPIDDLPPRAAIRARYAERVRDPASWRRFLRGGVDLRKLLRGLVRVAGASAQPDQALVGRVAAALGAAQTPVTIVLAEQDATALAFADIWAAAGHSTPIHRIPSASHSFAGLGDAEALETILRDVLTG